MASIASCMQAQAAEQPEPEVVPVTPRIAWIQQATEEFPGNIVTELIRVCGEGGSLDDLLEMSDMEITLRAYRYGLNPVNWEPHVALFNTIRHKKVRLSFIILLGSKKGRSWSQQKPVRRKAQRILDIRVPLQIMRYMLGAVAFYASVYENKPSTGWQRYLMYLPLLLTPFLAVYLNYSEHNDHNIVVTKILDTNSDAIKEYMENRVAQGIEERLARPRKNRPR
ncbi:hypothetical protein MBM_03092 [Drepanopeziza brunnea f. sp. 'multigermtubi' MB_m1]|uniref:Uncharacterized protein n=1 Tax=Marssonina brunnea f. sp. multigermtubi (strain MB_m1) TaxID=1072389 RepID=K1WMC0_MARBU|nr:uncharacterized protein MBM_03092 [Drepanopeziza brunnea f. sp. 'multigermtubi' MB_m1]EKD18850.1 hypothetical protein MBM_03092 [Drepanopeziza brunnea f. sp. 'multigermtubi' MB_m1]